MEMFCKDLRNQAMKIINYEKKEMISLSEIIVIKQENLEESLIIIAI